MLTPDDWQDVPAAYTANLHLPLVASSLRIAFQYEQTVEVVAAAEVVKVFARDALVLEILPDGEVVVYRHQVFQQQRIAAINTAFAWIGMRERVREYSSTSWHAGQDRFEHTLLLTHPNALRWVNQYSE